MDTAYGRPHGRRTIHAGDVEAGKYTGIYTDCGAGSASCGLSIQSDVSRCVHWPLGLSPSAIACSSVTGAG